MGKGDRREREAVTLYQRAGMGVYRPATVRYGENDIFGLFDLLAFSPQHEHIHAVQVKSNGASGIVRWIKHTELFRRLGFRTFYLVPYDAEGWRLIELGTFDKADRVDERELSCEMGQRVVDYLQSEQA